MSTGTVLRVRAGMKPIATVPQALRTVDVATGDTAAAHHQRSDVCAVPAAGVVAEAMVAIVLAEVVLEKFGGDSVGETRRNLEGYLAAIPETLRTRRARRARHGSRRHMTSHSDAVVLIGPMGAGKTSIGRRVAQDARRARSSTPTSPSCASTGRSRSIFAAHGEAHFRALERDGRARGARDGRRRLARRRRRARPRHPADLAAHRVVLLTVVRRTSSPGACASRAAAPAGARTRSRAGDDLRGPPRRSTTSSPTSPSTRRTGPLQLVVDAIVEWARTTAQRTADRTERGDEPK